MIGYHVTWRKKLPNGECAMPDWTGVVVGCERAGQPAQWNVLVMFDDGHLEQVPIDNVLVSETRENDDRPFDSWRRPADKSEPPEIVELWDFMLAEFGPVEAGSPGAIGRARDLMSQLKAEILEIDKERQRLGGERDQLEQQLVELRTKKKKPAGPAGPGEAS